MKRIPHILIALRRDTRGSALVEMAMIIPLLLVFLFAIIDYGRLYWNETALQKAMHLAARTAAVRTPVCGGVPATIPAAGGTTARFGTPCRTGGACGTIANQTCALTAGTTVGAEIWNRIRFLLPPGATAANVQLTYSFDGRIGFMGGPYSPIVTAEFVNMNFDFVLPIAPLLALAANDPTIIATSPTSITLPTMSTSMPGEDLAVGTN